MPERSRRWILWLPRTLAILVCLFLSLFALDALGSAAPFRDVLAEFSLHIAPMLVLLAVVAVAWRWEWVGACVFTALAVAYTYVARDHVSWVLSISVPLLVVGVLYGWSWRYHKQLDVEARMGGTR